ncbi:MAG: hydrolase, partial [Oscillospiraceae bacterium]|nr:hydrolase [Oscillospiraceae bacterium]
MKKHLKRALSLTLALLLLASLFACGKKEPIAEDTPSPDPSESVEPSPTPEPPPEDTAEPYTPEVPLVAWGKNQVVEHLFFHPVIAYPQWAFHDCPAPESDRVGLDDWMVTVDEYNKILQSVYDKGYVLVSMNDVWSEYTTETGEKRMQRNIVMVPEGKKPLIISYDDTNYYDYMLEQGFTSKLVIGTDGNIWAECTNPYTGETFLTRDMDA